MNNFIKIATVVGLALVFIALPFMGGWYLGEKRAFDRFEPHTDTLYIPREIVIEKPVEVVKWRTMLRTDTVRLASVDTLTVCDSVLVEVPIEQRVYADSNYTAVIRGYRPELESLTIFQKEKIITVKDYKRSKISLGVQAGYGVFGKELSPYIGVGISYNLIDFNGLKIK